MQLLGGFTMAEVASELGIAASSVLTRLFRDRNKLREIYRASSLDGGGEPQGAA
jgi:DNA-directed RNA polymerase specialized sigma24 family protein